MPPAGSPGRRRPGAPSVEAFGWADRQLVPRAAEREPGRIRSTFTPVSGEQQVKYKILLVLAVPVVLLGAAGPAVAQESVAQESAGAAEPASASISASDAQAYLGYWMLTAKLGERETKMGLELSTDREGGNPEALAGRLVSFFGEMTAENFRRVEDRLAFDLASGVGRFEVEIAVDDDEIDGRFADTGGQISADFTGKKSDRLSFELFLVPDNETRIRRGEEMVRLRFARPKAGGRDFEQIATLEPGQVVQFLEFGAIKLTTDFDLEFGDLAVETENVAANYPGVYSLWLKRTEDGWSLAFNHKPDVWGTQYDPSADLGEAPLVLETAAEESERLTAKLEEPAEGESEGTLELVWGPHRWHTSFRILPPDQAAGSR